jgi:hypothetical protein
MMRTETYFDGPQDSIGTYTTLRNWNQSCCGGVHCDAPNKETNGAFIAK